MTDRGQFVWDILPFRLDGRWIIALMFDKPLGHRPFRKWRMPGEQEVKRATKGVNIGSLVDIIAINRLFGGQIIGGPQNVLIMGEG